MKYNALIFRIIARAAEWAPEKKNHSIILTPSQLGCSLLVCYYILLSNHTILAPLPPSRAEDKQHHRNWPHGEGYKSEETKTPFWAKVGKIQKNEEWQEAGSKQACDSLRSDRPQSSRRLERVEKVGDDGESNHR